MVPYIAALIVLIVAILFMVYKRVDTFEIQGITIKDSTSIKDVLDYLKRYIDLNKALKDKLDSGESFDESFTESKAKELGMGYSKNADGTLNYEKPLSKALSSQIEVDLTFLQSIMDKIQKDITEKKITPTTTIREFTKMNSREPIPDDQPLDVAFLNEVIQNQVKTTNAREALVLKNLGGSKVAGVDTTDLYGAVGGVKEAIKSSTLDAATDLLKPHDPKESDKDLAPSYTFTSTKEMEERIAKNIAKQLKDQVLIDRATRNMMEDPSCPYAQYSNATAQGIEYAQARPTPTPDMSQYIRKDSIPCWNCSLP